MMTPLLRTHEKRSRGEKWYKVCVHSGPAQEARFSTLTREIRTHDTRHESVQHHMRCNV